MKRIFFATIAVVVVAAGGFFLLHTLSSPGNEIAILPGNGTMTILVPTAPVITVTSSAIPDGSDSIADTLQNRNSENVSKIHDIGPQMPLADPPDTVKAIYVTGWSAGSQKKVTSLIDLIETTELNSVVIDVKDFSGYVLYNTELSLPYTYDAVEPRILRLNTLIRELHERGIYIIARISVFQDQRLALARRDLAITSSSTGALWLDQKGLAWIDPAATEAWDYNISIAREALARGFDEVNFDYVRFISDGNLTDARYPFWNGKSSRRTVLRNFFTYLREQLLGKRISVDFFGLTTVASDDLGIGQYLEDAVPYFDYIAPMVYPSHYHAGFQGFANPAAYPYEVVRYSIETALTRIAAYWRTAGEGVEQPDATTTPSTTVSTTPLSVPSGNPAVYDDGIIVRAKLRPWLQNFDIGAMYTPEMVRKQVQAVYDAASSTPEFSNGWMLWSPANVYERAALEPAGTD